MLWRSDMYRLLSREYGADSNHQEYPLEWNEEAFSRPLCNSIYNTLEPIFQNFNNAKFSDEVHKEKVFLMLKSMVKSAMNLGVVFRRQRGSYMVSKINDHRPCTPPG